MSLIFFYLRDKFLSLHAVNVSWHIKGSNDIENIISASKMTTIETIMRDVQSHDNATYRVRRGTAEQQTWL